MTDTLMEAATEAIAEWKGMAEKNTEALLDMALSPSGCDPRFLRVLGPSLQRCQDAQRCAEHMLDALLRSIESTYRQHIASPKDIVGLALAEDHPREWERNACRFTLDGITFHVYTSTSSYGVAIGLGGKTASRVTKKMRAKDCADVIQATARAYPMCVKAVEELRERYGSANEAAKRVMLIKQIERISRCRHTV